MKRFFLLLMGFISCGLSYGQQLNPPGNVQVTTDAAASTATVTWSDLSDGEDGHVVIIKSAAGAQVDSTATQLTTSYTTGALAPGDYSVYVRAYSIPVAASFAGNLGNPSGSQSFTISEPVSSGVKLRVHNLSVDLGQVRNNLAVVMWDNTASEQADGFIITVTNLDTGVEQQINTAFGDAVKTLGGLTGNTRYSARIQAFSGTTMGPLSNIVSWKTNPDVPQAPSVTINKSCPSEVVGQYTTAAQGLVETYIVQKAFSAGGPWTALTTRNEGQSPFFSDREEDQLRGRTVWYRVFAENITGRSNPSMPVSTLVPDYVAPPAPLNVRPENIGPDKLTFRWDYPSSQLDNVCGTNLIGSVNYRYSINGGVPITGSDFPGVQTLTIDGLSMRDTVTIEVFYLNDRSTIASGIANGMGRTLGPPDAPINFRVIGFIDNLGYSNVNMVATDNSNDEDGFEYFVGLSPNPAEMISLGKSKFKSELGSEIIFTQKPVQEGVTYYYAIRGFNYLGNGPFTPVISGMMEYSRVPGIPYAVRANSGDGGIVVTWRDDSTVEESYVVEKSTNGGDSYEVIGNVGRNTFTFTDAGASASGDGIMYRVIAKNPVGESAPSMPAMVGGASQGRVALYPNPTVSSIKVTLDNKFNGTNGQLQIIDQNFRQVLSQDVKFNSNGIELDLSSLPEGLYNLVITTEEGKVSKKVQKF